MCPASPGEPQCTHIWGPAAVWSVYVSRRLCLSLSICFSVCLLVSAATHAQFVCHVICCGEWELSAQRLGRTIPSKLWRLFCTSADIHNSHESTTKVQKQMSAQRSGRTIRTSLGGLWRGSGEALGRLRRGPAQRSVHTLCTRCAGAGFGGHFGLPF